MCCCQGYSCFAKQLSVTKTKAYQFSITIMPQELYTKTFTLTMRPLSSQHGLDGLN